MPSLLLRRAPLPPSSDRFSRAVKYGAFKVNCEGSPRWVFLCFIGNSVHALSKEAAKIHWQQVASHLVGVSLSLCFTDLTQLEPKRIKKRCVLRARARARAVATAV